MKKRIPKTWLVCVFDNPWMPEDKKHLRRVYQVDCVDATGYNHESTNPDELAARGYAIPELSGLAQGQYYLATLTRVEGHGASEQLCRAV